MGAILPYHNNIFLSDNYIYSVVINTSMRQTTFQDRHGTKFTFSETEDGRTEFEGTTCEESFEESCETFRRNGFTEFEE